MPVLKDPWRHLVKRSLRGISRGLLALSILAALIAFCPCFSGTSEAMDGCCPPHGLSADDGCCDNASSSEAVASPALTPASLTPSLATLPTTGPFVSLVAAVSPSVYARPVAARTILRI